ncbi:hypothetical protein Mapa_002536 [Marchantia paleacea]|nr:hypothetical protein Mapa_002536 [Marchantia paleacea]
MQIMLDFFKTRPSRGCFFRCVHVEAADVMPRQAPRKTSEISILLRWMMLIAPLLAALPKPLQPKGQQIRGDCSTAPALQYIVKPKRITRFPECSRPVDTRGCTVPNDSQNIFLAPQFGILLGRIVFACDLLGTQSSDYSK